MSWVFDGAQRRDEPPPASASGYAMLCPQATTLSSPEQPQGTGASSPAEAAGQLETVNQFLFYKH